MLQIVQLSSLENILPKRQQEFVSVSSIPVLRGETASYQIAFRADETTTDYVLRVESDIASHVHVYRIGCVPVMRCFHNIRALDDDDYLSHDAGMFPDVLYPYNGEPVRAQYHYQGFWITVDGDLPAGFYDIRCTFGNALDYASTTMRIEVLNADLPPQKLIYHLAVHGDSIASYYGYEVFSEEYWAMLEKYIRTSAEYGSNMLMPPLFTPPLDTQIGGERLTVQLVDIEKNGNVYSFDFSKFHRFVDMCRNAGITHYFMTPFFTQWGARYTPKIMVRENGELKRAFGWDVESTDPRYLEFLRQFVPEVIRCGEELGIKDNMIFTISDEPSDEETIHRYAFFMDFFRPLLQGCKVMDAFSSYSFFKGSGADIAIAYNDNITDFIGKTDNVWLCYCCAQDYKVSNRFITMPLHRNRCFGYQMYKHGIKGFAHWAMNFYFAQLAVRPIDPFHETDSDGGFPGGDAFCVYPGEDGPILSMRIVAFRDALQDMRALQLLESYIGREETIRIVENVTGPITFENCPHNARTVLAVRGAITNKLRSILALGV